MDVCVAVDVGVPVAASEKAFDGSVSTTIVDSRALMTGTGVLVDRDG